MINANGEGVSGIQQIGGSYVAQNGSTGVAGGGALEVVSCTVLGNAGNGVSGFQQVSNSWVGRNLTGGLVGSNGSGNVLNSTVAANQVYGTKNISSASGCNLLSDSDVIALDNVTVGAGDRLFPGNFWGTSNTAILDSLPAFSDVPFVTDTLDGSGNWLVNLWPHAGARQNVPDAPGPGIPRGCSAGRTVAAVSVGESTFTLLFSEPMDLSVQPAVTFDTAEPYEAHVVQPSPGWVDSRTWQGSFWVQSDTGEGLNTLRVSSATAADGFVIPDDTLHQFVVDTQGSLSANNGLVSIVASATAAQFGWTENDKPPTAQGYNVRRTTDPFDLASYQKVNGAVLASASFTDTGLTPSTMYWYIVDVVDSDSNSVQWTVPTAVTTTVEPVVKADLGVTKQASVGSLQAGQNVVYTMVVSNQGPSDATQVVLSDPLPSGMSFVSATTSRAAWGTTAAR